jgi:hypothetical protein
MVAPDYDQLAPSDVPVDAAADCMANPKAPSIARQAADSVCP